MAVLWPLFTLDAEPMVNPVPIVGLVWAGQLWYVSYSVGTRLTLDVLGLANALTILRGVLYAIVMGVVVVPIETTLT